MTAEPANEREFRRWVEQETLRREIARLTTRLDRLEWMQLAGYVLIMVWTTARFVGYQLWPERVPADVAGFVTLWAWLGGGALVWRIIQLKRQTARRLEVARESLGEEGAE